MEKRYKIKLLLPRNFPTAIMVAILVAGPTKSKTKAAPGLAPFKIKAPAMGVAEVEQIYKGTPTAIIANMGKMPSPPKYSVMKDWGTTVEIRAAKT